MRVHLSTPAPDPAKVYAREVLIRTRALLGVLIADHAKDLNDPARSPAIKRHVVDINRAIGALESL